MKKVLMPDNMLEPSVLVVPDRVQCTSVFRYCVFVGIDMSSISVHVTVTFPMSFTKCISYMLHVAANIFDSFSSCHIVAVICDIYTCIPLL